MDINSSVAKDTVILHTLDRGKTVPSVSPFVLKLETFFRMGNIPYEIDTSKPFGPSGKTPWITLNRVDYSDSQLIIEHLTKYFNIDLWGTATAEQKAVARSMRVMMEEHCFWGVARWRFIEGVQTVPQIMVISSFKFRALKLIMPGRIKKTLDAQGLGRHDWETCFKLTIQDVRDISTFLADKKFILGDEPCEADCCFFGFLAQALWAAPGSPYEKFVQEDARLKGYVERMKNKFWPDWSDCLAKPAIKK